MRTAPGNTDCAEWERAVTEGGWRAAWIDEALKLHAQYVVLASFHSRLGYARAWPSQIPGTCATKRDFLRELIDAEKAKGVKTILNMTDDPQWFGLLPFAADERGQLDGQVVRDRLARPRPDGLHHLPTILWHQPS